MTNLSAPAVSGLTSFVGCRCGVPDDQFQQELTRRNLTAGDMRGALRRDLLTQKVLEREVVSKVIVGDQARPQGVTAAWRRGCRDAAATAAP